MIKLLNKESKELACRQKGALDEESEDRMILKRISWSCLLVMTTLSLVSLAGCSHTNDGDVSTDASGDYINSDFLGTWKDEKDGQELTFNKDGSVSGTYFTDVSQYFSYSVDENVPNVAFIYIEGQGKRNLHSVAMLNPPDSLTYEGKKYTKSQDMMT